jgi:nucleoid-associated protein YgaU
MTKSFNRIAVYAVFNQADKSSVSFAEQLLALGIGSRTDARPLAMEWASKKYNVALKEGQRGTTFVKVDTDAERAMNRVLQVCFPSADAPKPKTGKATANKVDAVAKLVEKYQALTAVEKRRFLKSI